MFAVLSAVSVINVVITAAELYGSSAASASLYLRVQGHHGCRD